MSSSFRIDAGIIYTPADLFTVDVGGGALDVSLGTSIGATDYFSDISASGTSSVRNTIEDHLNDVAAGFTVTEVNGRYEIDNPVSFAIEFPNDSIREFLGFSSALYPGGFGAPVVSDVRSPAVFIGSRPAYATPGFRWYTRRSGVTHTHGRSHLLSSRELFDLSLRITADELDDWRLMADYMLRGHPFRFMQLEDGADPSGFETSAVSATVPNGCVDCHLDPSVMALGDEWLSAPLLDEMALTIRVLKVT